MAGEDWKQIARGKLSISGHLRREVSQKPAVVGAQEIRWQRLERQAVAAEPFDFDSNLLQKVGVGFQVPHLLMSHRHRGREQGPL